MYKIRIFRQNHIHIYSKKIDGIVHTFERSFADTWYDSSTINQFSRRLSESHGSQHGGGNEVILVPTGLDQISFSRSLIIMTHLFLILFAESFIVWDTAEEKCDTLTESLNIWENNQRIYLQEEVFRNALFFVDLKTICYRKSKKERKKERKS